MKFHNGTLVEIVLEMLCKYILLILLMASGSYNSYFHWDIFSVGMAEIEVGLRFGDGQGMKSNLW